MFKQFRRIGEIGEKRSGRRYWIQIQELDGVGIQTPHGNYVQAAGSHCVTTRRRSSSAGTKRITYESAGHRSRCRGVQDRTDWHRSSEGILYSARLTTNQILEIRITTIPLS